MKFFELIPSNTNINFIGKFKYFVGFSIVTLLAVLYGLIFGPGLNFGVDFTGGTVMQVKFKTPQSAEQVRATLTEIGETDATVVAMGKENLEYLITTPVHNESSQNEALNRKMLKKIGESNMQVLQMDVVGPKVGADLKASAIRSLLYSVILIMIYIWLRFDMRFAPGATIAMIHDIIMVTGFYIVTRHEFTITGVAALLTIAGYSVNDTIVIYDRVREIIKNGGEGIPLRDLINKAVNATLSRTVLTAAVTLVSIVPIIIFCKGELQSFAMAMCFGIFVGVYSTIYIASPFTLIMERYLEKKNKKSGSSRPVVVS